MSSYYERQKSLFNTLKDAEEQYSFSKSNKATDAQDYGVIDKQSYKRLKKEMKQFRGKESIYKRQEAKMRDCLRPKTIPQYMKNPQNWQYYTLSDVTPEQMSDATNTATALAFMKKMEESDTENILTDTDETGAVFKKPIFQVSKTIKINTEDENRVVFKSSKVIMPEYVVGVSQKKKICKKISHNREMEEDAKKADVKLNHLFDDEADDSINDDME